MSRDANPDAGRHPRWFIAALILGLAVRLIVLSQTSSLGTPIVDEQQYSQLARNLVAGNGFAWAAGEPTSIRPPAYPWLVATVWRLAGSESLQAVRILQIFFAVVTVVVVYQLGRRAFDAGVARVAAATFWLYPSLIFFNFTILTETLYTLLLTTFVLLVVMLVQRPRAVVALACGLALGTATLTRSVLWPLPIVLCPLLFLFMPGRPSRRIALAALVAAGFAAVITPWAIRNTRLQGVTTIVDTMGGINLRQGNYEYTLDDRMWDTVSLTGDKNWVYAIRDANIAPPITEGKKEKWAQAKAFEYIRAHPGTTLRRAAIKFADFWGLEREFVAGVQQGYYHPPTWFAMAAGALVVIVYALVALLGIAGIWLAAPSWRVHVLMLLPLVAIMSVHMIVFGHSRYHMPLIPILATYAAAMAIRLRAGTWRGPRWAMAGAGLSLAILLAVWLRQLVFTDASRLRALFDLLR